MGSGTIRIIKHPLPLLSGIITDTINYGIKGAIASSICCVIREFDDKSFKADKPCGFIWQ